MPGGLQKSDFRKLAARLLGNTPSPRTNKQQERYEYHRPSSNMDQSKIKADDVGVGDFVRVGMNGGY